MSSHANRQSIYLAWKWNNQSSCTWQDNKWLSDTFQLTKERQQINLPHSHSSAHLTYAYFGTEGLDKSTIEKLSGKSPFQGLSSCELLALRKIPVSSRIQWTIFWWARLEFLFPGPIVSGNLLSVFQCSKRSGGDRNGGSLILQHLKR